MNDSNGRHTHFVSGIDRDQIQVGPPPHIDETEITVMAMEKQMRTLLDAYGVELPISLSDLGEKDIQLDFLVDGILAAGQSGIIAGASKTLKTSLAVDLSMSLAFGLDFLGAYPVTKPRRVLMFTIESGEYMIKDTCLRVAKAKSISKAEWADQIHFHCDWAPTAGNSEHIDILRLMIRDTEADVVILDPTYLMIDGDNMANIQKQGTELRNLADAVLTEGATPLLVDHIKLTSGNAKEHRPLELGDLSGAGKAAVFRQWVLVSRRERFVAGSDNHRLWMTTGGSHGFHSETALDINEARDVIGSRNWGVETIDAAEAAREVAEKKKEAAEAKKQETRERHVAELWEAYVKASPDGLTDRKAKSMTSLNSPNFQAAKAALINRSRIEETVYLAKNKQQYEAYRCTQ